MEKPPQRRPGEVSARKFVRSSEEQLPWQGNGAHLNVERHYIVQHSVKTKRTLIRTSARMKEPYEKRDLQGLLQVHILGLELGKLR